MAGPTAPVADAPRRPTSLTQQNTMKFGEPDGPSPHQTAMDMITVVSAPVDDVGREITVDCETDTESQVGDVMFRLQVERRALQRSCAAWLEQLERLQHEHFGMANPCTSTGTAFNLLSPLGRLRPDRSELDQPLTPSSSWTPSKPEAERPETPMMASPTLRRPETTNSLVEVTAKQPGSDLDTFEVSDQEILDSARGSTKASAKGSIPLSGRPQSRGAWEEPSKAKETPNQPRRGSTHSQISPAKSRTGQDMGHHGEHRAKSGMRNFVSIGAPAKRASLKRYNTMGLAMKRSRSRSFAGLKLADDDPMWMRVLNSINTYVNTGCSERAKALHEYILFAREAAQERCLFKVVHGGTWQSMASVVIVLNALYIGANTEATLNAEIAGHEPDPAWVVVDLVFAVWFTFELLLKLVAERLVFFFGNEWQWNLMDTILVVASIVDVAVNGSGADSSSNGNAASNITAARVLRLARFVRLFRLVHTIRFFSSFRIVVLGILQSLSSLYWCFLVIGFIIYMFSVFFMNGVSEYFKDQGGLRNDELSMDLAELYGGLRQSMVTLFMTISGGMDWTQALKPLSSMSLVYEAVFLFYIFFMFFAVLNVVIGTFVATTSEISSRDRDTMVKAEIMKWEGYAKKIKEFFHEADTDHSGMLSWEEFEAYLQNSKVRAYFQALELDVSQAYALFKILDVDGTGEVTPDEFVDGCMRLKNQAKSLDIKLLMYQNEMVFSKLKVFMEFAMQRFMSIDSKMSSVLGRHSAAARTTVHADSDRQNPKLRTAGDAAEGRDELRMPQPASELSAPAAFSSPRGSGDEDEV